MKYPYKISCEKGDDHTFWTAKSIYLKGCVGRGDSLEEALQELEKSEAEQLETAARAGHPLPPVLKDTEEGLEQIYKIIEDLSRQKAEHDR